MRAGLKRQKTQKMQKKALLEKLAGFTEPRNKRRNGPWSGTFLNADKWYTFHAD